MKVFYQNYHISVNDCLVDDLLAIGLEVLVPTFSFAKDRISFYAPNAQHYNKKGVRKIEYKEFLSIEEPITLILPCSQLYDDFMTLYNARGKKDRFVVLSSQNGFGKWLDEKKDWAGTDYLITHELEYHRITKAKHKILYFNRPKVIESPKTPEEIRKSFEGKKIKLYINHFDTTRADGTGSFVFEKADALELRKLWEEETGYRIPFYGFENKDGYLPMDQVQREIKDSMFTLVFKAHETWGQMVNESMLLGTPCIFKKSYIVDMFTQYLITPETAVIGMGTRGIFEYIKEMTLDQYEALAFEAQKMSEMFTEERNRREKLAWLFSKIN